MKNRKSFTLMELLVVITIIAVLAAVSIPQVIGVIQRAQDVAIRTSMRVMLTEATRISILEGDLSRIHCNTGGHPDILAVCETVRAHSPYPAQLRSSATTRTFWIRAPLHDGTFWRVDHTGFAGRDLADYIARWDMDEGSDQVVGDATGTNPGTRGPTTTLEPQDPTWGVSYLTLDGVDDRVDVPHSERLNEVFGTATVFTLEAWAHPRTWADHAGIINKMHRGCWWDTTNGIWVSTAGFSCVMGSNAYPICNPAGGGIRVTHRPVLNEWHHIVCVADGTNLRMYVNNIYRGSVVIALITHPRSTNIQPVIMGRRSAFAAPSFNGLIDNVRIYNRALTAEEVRISFLRGR